MKNLMLLLLAFLLPFGTRAQETVVMPKRGMVMQEGVWQAPTPATALRAVMAHEEPDADVVAVAVPRQTFDTRPAAELDAFAADLGRLVLEGTGSQSFYARMALIFAASDYYEGGTPYAGAVDVFIRLYESLEGRTHPRAHIVLVGLFQAGGADYVRDLFKASEQPSEPCFSPHRVVVLLLGAEEPPPAPPREKWCPNESV